MKFIWKSSEKKVKIEIENQRDGAEAFQRRCMCRNSSWVANPSQMPLFADGLGTVLYLITQPVTGDRERGDVKVEELTESQSLGEWSLLSIDLRKKKSTRMEIDWMRSENLLELGFSAGHGAAWREIEEVKNGTVNL